MKRKKFASTIYGKSVLVMLLLLSVFMALRYGSADMSLRQFIMCFLGNGSEKDSVIIFSVRLPRVLGALLCGVGLSVSGVLLQAVTNNSLASPNIIGVNAGAGFAVIFLLCFLPGALYLRALAAFFGAFVTTIIIILLSRKISASRSTVVLCGIAVTTLLNAGISFLSYLDTDVMAVYRYFSVGGLSGVELNELSIPFVIIAVCFFAALFVSNKIDVLSLGDSFAVSLGVNAKALRIFCIVLSSAAAASVVSFAGLLGFVGLVVPHIAKRLTDGKTQSVLSASAVIGATLVCLADLVGRVVLSPSEIPVGIVMAFIGAPFFFFLLLRGRSYGRV